MLGHHVDITEAITTSLARLVLDLQKTTPDSLSLEALINYVDFNPFKALPSDLRRSVFRLVGVFQGARLAGEVPPWQGTFDSFLLDSFPRGALKANRLHLTSCLKIMAKELRFDLYKLPSSFLRNDDVRNLQLLEGAKISSHLHYACCHWADHFSELETLDADLVNILSGFFQTYFLYWLEVMSIVGLSPAEVLKKLDVARVCTSPSISTAR